METYAALAERCLSLLIPRYKLRPKFHMYHCELVLSYAASLKRARWGSCFMEEDLVGQLVKIAKGSVHSSSVSLRILQRWLLHFNCQMVKLGRVPKNWSSHWLCSDVFIEGSPYVVYNRMATGVDHLNLMPDGSRIDICPWPYTHRSYSPATKRVRDSTRTCSAIPSNLGFNPFNPFRWRSRQLVASVATLLAPHGGGTKKESTHNYARPVAR